MVHDNPAMHGADTTDSGAIVDKRRPIRSRGHRVWQRCADALARAGVSANTVSVLGMAAAILAGALAVLTSVAPTDGNEVVWRLLWLGAAALVLLRLIANMLDGMVAERRGDANPLGELFNEAPDRVSDASVLVGLGYAAGGLPTLGWAAATVAVFVAYVRSLGAEAGAPPAFMGPMAKQQRMFTVIATALAVATLPTAWTVGWAHDGAEAVRYCRWCPGLPALALWLVVAGGVFTAGRRLRYIAGQLRAAAQRERPDVGGDA